MPAQAVLLQVLVSHAFVDLEMKMVGYILKIEAQHIYVYMQGLLFTNRMEPNMVHYL